jgi:uncharacterized protein YlxP (DUF503 family)
MIVGSCLIELDIPFARSLKDKRSVVKSMIARVQNQFKISAAEVGDLDIWRSAQLGLAVVSNSAPHASEVLQKAVRYLEEGHWDAEIVDVQYETEYVFE